MRNLSVLKILSSVMSVISSIHWNPKSCLIRDHCCGLEILVSCCKALFRAYEEALICHDDHGSLCVERQTGDGGRGGEGEEKGEGGGGVRVVGGARRGGVERGGGGEGGEREGRGRGRGWAGGGGGEGVGRGGRVWAGGGG